MREGFFGLNVAVRGLYTAQRALDVVNHNLNNVNTPGYSRQQAVQTAARPMHIFDGTGMLGTGSDVKSIERIRDEYMDFKYWSENIAMGEWNVKRELLADIEATINEPSNSGFNKILAEFFSSLQELGKDPSSSAVRSLVREKGVMVAKYFNSVAAHFEKLQADVNDRIKTKVGEINSIGTQIQQLNRQIYATELDGSNANDLRDQRALLVDRLSRIINMEANEVVVGKLPGGKDDKRFVISVSGKAFIDHFQLTRLSLNMRQTGQKLNAEDIENLYEISWEDKNTLEIKGGELKGLLEIRDGNDGDPAAAGYPVPSAKSPLYKGIPFYQKKLNQFVRTFAMAFNEGFIDGNGDKSIDDAAGENLRGHADGYKLDSVQGEPPSGIRFFTRLGENGKPVSSAAFIGGAATNAEIYAAYDSITAKNFAVSEDIQNDIKLISASDAPGQVGNINNLNSVLSMRRNPKMFAEGAPEDFMKSLVSILGVDSQQAVVLSGNHEVIVKQLENRRISISGVSIDEEMANLVKFQQAYNASAKMITTMAEVYDTLINRMGVR
ncbi:MAG: flagellar hook-associated protein FlgK [Clostridia bacterium]|nr:flagellar hook-associated protein FlgK [Clostridia bacterium]